MRLRIRKLKVMHDSQSCGREETHVHYTIPKDGRGHLFERIKTSDIFQFQTISTI